MLLHSSVPPHHTHTWRMAPSLRSSTTGPPVASVTWNSAQQWQGMAGEHWPCIGCSTGYTSRQLDDSHNSTSARQGIGVAAQADEAAAGAWSGGCSGKLGLLAHHPQTNRHPRRCAPSSQTAAALPGIAPPAVQQGGGVSWSGQACVSGTVGEDRLPAATCAGPALPMWLVQQCVQCATYAVLCCNQHPGNPLKHCL
jgi:hypothetical protein